jgi:hypothetical protein
MRRKPLNERRNNLLQEGAIEVCKNEIILAGYLCHRGEEKPKCITERLYFLPFEEANIRQFIYLLTSIFIFSENFPYPFKVLS